MNSVCLNGTFASVETNYVKSQFKSTRQVKRHSLQAAKGFVGNTKSLSKFALGRGCRNDIQRSVTVGSALENGASDLIMPGVGDTGANDLILPGVGDANLYLPEMGLPTLPEVYATASPGAAERSGGGYDQHKPRTPPPDLPSLLLDSRIVFLGMPLVPAVTELIVAEMLYMQYTDPSRPLYFYINSTGCTRADGTVVGFETEATAIYDTMSYIGCEIHTVCTGVAIGQACMLLSAGDPGKRFMLPHATAMLQQPRVPSTGQRQAVEIYIKWREVLRMKKTYLDILSRTTGHSIDKLDRDMLRPLYMQPLDALEYGIIDQILTKEEAGIDKVTSANEWDTGAGLVQKQA